MKETDGNKEIKSRRGTYLGIEEPVIDPNIEDDVVNTEMESIPACAITGKMSIPKNKQASFNDEKRYLFLESLSKHGVVKYACEDAGISQYTFYYTFKHDAEFRAMTEDCIRIGAINLEDEAKIRAIYGVEEPVFFKGEQVGTTRRFSDYLLSFLLRGNFPHKYGDRGDERVAANLFGELRMKIDRAIRDSDIKYEALSDEQLYELINKDDE